VTGLFWWFPEENESGKTVIKSWINRGLFDNQTGYALPALKEMRRFVLKINELRPHNKPKEIGETVF
jgi:arabinogalactan endo-1,4-beta-galactosidase